ncbi:MAG: hypothetical protein HYW97_02450 [Candidatus Wildermuthbacteria bacterium]|nr:hypothetical protein [Candidatus Wildermuthbacteria bacterium]
MKQMMPILLTVMIITIIGVVYLFQGVGMQNRVPLEEQKFNDLQAQYFNLSKAERDAAATGSELSAQLVRINQYPSQLLELKLVGVGKILTGIFALLFVIGIFLFMMPIRFAQMMKRE